MLICKLRKFKKRYRFFREGEDTIIKRKSDGTLWIASHNGRLEVMLGLMGLADAYYFRRCKPFRDGYIVDWNQVWQHNDSALFDIYKREPKFDNHGKN